MVSIQPILGHISCNDISKSGIDILVPSKNFLIHCQFVFLSTTPDTRHGHKMLFSNCNSIVSKQSLSQEKRTKLYGYNVPNFCK